MLTDEINVCWCTNLGNVNKGPALDFIDGSLDSTDHYHVLFGKDQVVFLLGLESCFPVLSPAVLQKFQLFLYWKSHTIRQKSEVSKEHNRTPELMFSIWFLFIPAGGKSPVGSVVSVPLVLRGASSCCGRIGNTCGLTIRMGFCGTGPFAGCSS